MLNAQDGYFTLCGLHYCNLFADPRMNVLFDTRKPDSAVSAMDVRCEHFPAWTLLP
jgi:hypothetical protein